MRPARYIITSLLLICALMLSGCQWLPEIEIPSPAEPAPEPAPPAAVTPIDPGWQPPQQPGQTALLPAIADVVAEVRPAVVAINTEVVSYDIFNRPFTQEGAGSGWIIDESGIIVTNNHVVQGAQSVTATLSDDSVFPVEMVRTDPLTDLAVGMIDAGDLPAARIGTASELRVGEWVVAIGNPLGLGISAKEGIISRMGVPVTVGEGQTLYDLLETSAAINPGNSGGPLVNLRGEVIGITSVKIATVGVEGLGYAINIDSALPIIESLVQTGYVTRPWLGVGLRTVDSGLALRYRLAVDKGTLITEVAAGSPADMAGLKAGDIIVSFDGKEIASMQDLREAIHASRIGQTVSIGYWHGEIEETTTAKLVENPPPG